MNDPREKCFVCGLEERESDEFILTEDGAICAECSLEGEDADEPSELDVLDEDETTNDIDY